MVRPGRRAPAPRRPRARRSLGGVIGRRSVVGKPGRTLRQRIFDRAGRGVGEQRDVQRDRAGPAASSALAIIARRAGRLEIGAQPRRDVGGDRDAARPAHRVERQRHVVVARQLARNPARSRCAVLRDAARASPVASLTPTNASGNACDDPRHRRGLDVGHGAAGHVVEDDRQRRVASRAPRNGGRCPPGSGGCNRAGPSARRRRRRPSRRAMLAIATRVSFEPRRRSPARGPSPDRRRRGRRGNARRSVSVAASPVVPHGTSAADPSAICHSTRSRNAASSNAPSPRTA